MFPMDWLLVGNIRHLRTKPNLTKEEEQKLTRLKEELEFIVEEHEKDLQYLKTQTKGINCSINFI